jgi:hypothetical protein
MAGEPGWVTPETDTRRANAARVYDYWLGGSCNFLADQDVARALAAVEPGIRAMARANRAFLGRAVRFLAAAGIDQFLDIGAGLPTRGNVHQVAQTITPGARVVYVDNDPMVLAHTRALKTGQDATVIHADLRDIQTILEHPDTARLIDFTQPLAVLFVAVLHFIADPDAHAAVARFVTTVAPGSYLALSHLTAETEDPQTAAPGADP